MRAVALSGALLMLLSACSDTSAGDEQSSSVETTDTDAMAVPVETEGSFGVEPRPVRIGFDGPDMDACGSYGVIEGLNPDGDNFLSVRAAPSVDAEERDRLTSGTGVSVCDSTDGWIGIVYEGSGTQGAQCGTGSPVADVREYDGPCQSGWVSERFVDLVAG